MIRKPADCDVIVVGAGPAGSATALLLARSGVRVLLLDRHAFPRAKPCGDCLSTAAGAVLERLGVLTAVHALPHAALRGWRIVAPDGNCFEAAFCDIAADDALAVERRLLDTVLRDAARSAGARYRRAHVTDVLRVDGRVTGVLLRDGTALHAPLVIGADGLRSIVATRLGLIARPPALRKLSLTFHLDAAIATDGFGEMHVADGCCAGIAPLAADGSRCNLTVVVTAGTARSAAPRLLARAAIDRMPALRSRVPAGLLDDAPCHASGPFDRPVRRVVVAGAALAGDAAGYYDPFTGQGIYQALRGAELLARVVLSALGAGDTSASGLAPYAAARAAELRGTRLVQQGIEAVLSRPVLATTMIRRVRHAPRFAHALLAVTGDSARPASLLSAGALASLVLPSGHRSTLGSRPEIRA